MTEDEAKAKWCPFVRETSVVVEKNTSAALGNRYVANRRATETELGQPEAPGPVLYSNPPGARCIGSACMAWRRGAHAASGYCGLAGVPPS